MHFSRSSSTRFQSLFPVAFLIGSLVLNVTGCSSSPEAESVAKLPPRSEVEKNIGTPFLQEGMPIPKSQMGGGKDMPPAPASK